MADTAASRKLAQKLANYEARIKALEDGARTPQLQNASITGAALTIYDDDGETPLQYIGKQADGSQGIVHVNGPTPPAPSAATVEPTPLGLTVSWDGTFVDDIPQPAGFDHVSVHVTTENVTATASGDTDGTYLVAADADATDVAVGDTVVLAHADGTPVDDVTHTVTLMESAFGFTNIHLDPVAPPLVTGDVATVVDLSEGTRKGTLSRAGSISLTPLTTDPHYVRLVAVSASGIQSDPSAQTAGTPNPAADIGPGDITETEIADDSISTPKLRALAVTADKLAANSVVAGKIDAGAVTAETLAAMLVIASTMQSQNYAEGTSGWQIDGVGDAEFNSATLRGQAVIGPDDGPQVVIRPTVDDSGVDVGVLQFPTHDPDETVTPTLGSGSNGQVLLLTIIGPRRAPDDTNMELDLYSAGETGDSAQMVVWAGDVEVAAFDADGIWALTRDGDLMPALYAGAWHNLTLTSPYQNHTFGYPAQYRFISRNTVQLRGVVSRSSGAIATSDVVAALPAAIRPAEQHCGLVACGTASGSMWSVRMDVRDPNATDHANSLVPVFTAGFQGSGTTTAPSWISLDGIVYDLT